MPLKFTGGLGGALAGRPIAIRYVDNRELGKAAGNAVMTDRAPDVAPSGEASAVR